jgi:hypothetical protein
MRFSFVKLGLVAMAAAGLAPVHAALLGSDVTGTLLFPDLSTVFSGPEGPFTVSGAVEFTTGTLTASGSIDVTDNQIIWTAAFSTSYGSGAFNGFRLVFSGAPPITNVTLNPATTLTPVGFSFTGNEVFFNLAGVSAATGQQTILDVTVGPTAIPEPGTPLMLGIGILGLATAGARRFLSSKMSS